ATARAVARQLPGLVGPPVARLRATDRMASRERERPEHPSGRSRPRLASKREPPGDTASLPEDEFPIRPGAGRIGNSSSGRRGPWVAVLAAGALLTALLVGALALFLKPPRPTEAAKDDRTAAKDKGPPETLELDLGGGVKLELVR